MNDNAMKCPNCGTERASRYAAYCHVCGGPLPELPPAPGDQPETHQQAPVPPQSMAYQQPPVAPPPPTEQPTGPVRVYDRPDVPPSQVRRKRLTIAIAIIGVLISLLLLFLGPLRSVFSARSEPAWTPPGTETPITGAITTTNGLPPGMSAAQATARARNGTPTRAPTWTPGVDLGAVKGSPTVSGALPTLAPAPTTTPRATATLPPTAVPSTATSVPPTATMEPTAEPGTGAAIPGAISGGRALAFVSDRTGSPQVWVMDATGGNQTQVTQTGSNAAPSWSLDNRFLYYISERGGDKSVYRLDVTTGREERLVSDPGLVSARPMPNGQLAVVRMEEGRYTLYAGDRRLYQLDRSFQFQFSPDGRRALIDPNAPPRVIIVVDVTTTQAAEVASANAWNATWGAGSRLAYVSDRTGVAGVYIAGPNGEEARPVSPGDKWSQAPAFSSDGSAVAFIGGDGPIWNVYIVPATGGEARRVGGPANPGKSPLWQPAGNLLAYESDRSGNWDIYVTDPNGNERNLTNASGNDSDPAWTW